MTTQTSINIFSTNSRIDFVLFADDQESIQFFASDLGYEISEDDLANTMTAPTLGNIIDEAAPQINPDEFEAAYNWFIS